MFIFPLRFYYEDTDCGGIVYHANFLKYFERARSEWAEQVGLGVEWQREQGISFVVSSIRELHFFKPGYLHQKVEVVSRVIESRRASVVYDQYLRLAGLDDTILCRAKIRVVCVNKKMKPCGLPEKWVQLMK